MNLDFLKNVDTPTLSNAIEQLGVRPRREGFTPCELRCLYPGTGPHVRLGSNGAGRNDY